MSNVIRPDTFSLEEDGFSTPGFYQIRKDKGTSDSRYLEQIFLAKEQQAPLNSARDDFVGVIIHAT